MKPAPLHVRWLGRTRYRDAYALQHALSQRGADNWLLCQEHEPTYTMGVRTDPANILVDPATVGAELVRAEQGASTLLSQQAAREMLRPQVPVGSREPIQRPGAALGPPLASRSIERM